jgi:hypothetical protein
MLVMLVLTLAVPSVSGVMAEQRMRRTFDAFDSLVQTAVERSISERQPYLIAWTKDAVVLTTDERIEDENAGEAVVESLPIGEDEEYGVTFPAAIEKEPPLVWTFWPTGTCETAVVSYRGGAGSWTVRYNPLTAMGTFQASEVK